MKHDIIHGRMPPYSPQSNGVAERKNRTYTDLVNSMLETTELSKAWWGAALLTSCHVLNIVPLKSKEKAPYEKWFGRKPSLSYLRTWGCLAKVNVPINKKRKLGPKIVDCVFLGYAHHSTAYRFLVIKSKIHDVYIDTFLESRDVTFFENIFPMKNSYDMSSLPINVLADTSPEPSENFDHAKYTPEPIHEEIDSEAPRSKRPMTAKSFGDDFTIYLVDDTPKTIVEAFASPNVDEWKEAVHSEMDSILSNET
jgi:hypothetical protein